MLGNLGVVNVQMASNGAEVLQKCQGRRFDLILCDYDLGKGKTGQHVLEELRHKRLIPLSTVFIIVSAEASRNVVLSSYDCEPDDYLTKPITGMMLQKRMQRLLTQKNVLRPVFKALSQKDNGLAMEILTEMSLGESRYSSVAQKMLGELFIEQGEYQKAEKLYTRALEVRQVDWARLGLAKVKSLKGELEVAEKWLNKIVEENPLFLPAYDTLADNCVRKGDRHEAQETIERAVGVSPMSILRQKRLAKVANQNADTMKAFKALKNAIRLGMYSCHGSAEDHFELARTVSQALENDLPLPENAVSEAVDALEAAKGKYFLKAEQNAQMSLLKGRIHAADRDVYAAEKYLKEYESMAGASTFGIDADVDRVALLFSINEQEQAEELLKQLQHKYRHDQEALEKLDQFLSEPASESNRALVSTVNREGIDLYTDGEYEDAVDCFDKARRLFPRHIGIQLNIVQALLGKLKNNPADNIALDRGREAIKLVSELIDSEHPQYERYQRLKKRSEKYF